MRCLICLLLLGLLACGNHMTAPTCTDYGRIEVPDTAITVRVLICH
jgi:hypothetical protein